MMINDQEPIAPTCCSLCGCNKMYQHLMEVTHTRKIYCDGVLVNTEEKAYATAINPQMQYQCSACGKYDDNWHPLQRINTEVEKVPSKLTLRVEKDPAPLSPRDSTYSICKIYLLHSQGSCQGDVHPYKLANFGSWDQFRNHLSRYDAALFIKSLYYDINQHILSYSVPYSSIGYQVGFMFTTQRRIERYDPSHKLHCENIENIMTRELKKYNQYLMRDIWRFVICDAPSGKVLKIIGNFCSEHEAREAGLKAMEGI